MRIKAPPVEGKASDELVSWLAKKLDLRKSAIRLLKGAASRKKIIEIDGMSKEQLCTILGVGEESR